METNVKKRRRRKSSAQKASQTLRTNTLKKYERIRQQFIQLYEDERIRHDDCIARIADTWCMTPKSIEQILSKKV